MLSVADVNGLLFCCIMPKHERDQSERIGLFLDRGYEKDIFAGFAYDFELTN